MRKTILAAGVASLFMTVSQASAQQAAVCICGAAGPHSHGSVSTDDATAAPFQLTGRWSGNVASGPAGLQGDPITLRWSIVPDGTAIPGGVGIPGESSNPSSLRTFMDGLYGAGPGGADLTQRPWFSVFNNSYNRWAQVSGITFTYEPADDGSALYTTGPFGPQAGAAGQIGFRGDMRVGGHAIDGASGTLAYNFFPSVGEMVIDTGDGGSFGPNVINNNRSARNIITHEAGHGIGLNHVISNTTSQLMEPFLSTAFDGPQFDDILGAQRHYGDALEKGAGNNTAANATPLGTILHGNTASRGTHADDAAVDIAQTDFISIDDEGDVDVFGFTVSPLSEVTITLTPKGPTYDQGAQGGPAPTSFNASAQSNLNLELLASNGTTVLATAAANGIGGTEIISGFDLIAGGNFFARVTGLTTDVIQMYRLDVSAVAVPEPGVLALAGMAFAGLALRRRRRA